MWTLGDVCEYVESPTRMVRLDPNNPENLPFKTINRLGEQLNRFSSDYQDMLVNNFIETLEQLEEDN
jgi:hypothetical protein